MAMQLDFLFSKKSGLILGTALSAVFYLPTSHASGVFMHERTGGQIYVIFCSQCHDSGWEGAPVAQYKSDWEERLPKGIDAMLQTVISGSMAMPPNGQCGDCSEHELRHAVEYMVTFEE